MTTQQLQANSHEMQDALFGVAVSLDAFLLNGIQCGVFQQPVFGDFLQKTGRNLTRDLERLQGHVEQASAARPALVELRERCQQLIGLVTWLTSFRTMPLDRVRLAASEIAPLRAGCVRLIQELESRLRTPTPFYASRPVHSAASVDAFLAGLDRAFVEEWNASGHQG